MIIEAYFGLAFISLILFVTSFNDKAPKIVPLLAVTFMLITSMASFDIEKSYLSSENTLCNTITEYPTTNTSHCVDFTTTKTYTTTTYQNSFPLAIMFAMFGFTTLLLVLKNALGTINNNR